jgi:hypothetical protein
MPAKPRPAVPTFVWPLVLCVVGLDYFSTLAYLPSIAVRAAGPLAPLAALGVVAVTLLAALPVYAYVVGRSPHGLGAVGLLEKNTRGWHGKTLILVVLGFIAADFVVTRTLSVADAAAHVSHDPFWNGLGEQKESLRSVLPWWLRTEHFDLGNEQLALTLTLSMLSFGFYALLARGFRRWFVRLAVVVVGTFLILNAVVIGRSVAYLLQHPDIFETWAGRAGSTPQLHADGGDLWAMAAPVALLFLLSFPQLALGLSGFELTMASVTLVRGRPGDDPQLPRGRIGNARRLLLAAAVIMSLFIFYSVFVVTLLVPASEFAEGRPAAHRALAFLAHDARLLGDPLRPWFGLAYDVSAVSILCLAGASAAVGFRDLTPHFLARFGMQLSWAHKVGVVQHLFNVVILVVIIYFKAGVADQEGAYTTSVLVLLASAAFAACLDVQARWRGYFARFFLAAPFAVAALLFLVLIGSLFVQGHLSGLVIALLFVAVVLATAFVSRWLRSTEPRFEGFVFADEATEKRWKEVCQLEFQVLAPHRPGHGSLADKEAYLRKKHRIGPEVPILFIEAELGDPSDFHQAPLMHVVEEDGREVVRVTRCCSVAHTLASIALEFRRVGRPPELYFDWSPENPMAANLHFLLMGQGNVPWMVHELIRKTEPDPSRRPRVVLG